jgi:penicillin amidase
MRAEITMKAVGAGLFLACLLTPLQGQAPTGFDAIAKQSVSQYEGTLAVPGLKDTVQVVRDQWGVPHISAKNLDDLFMAQGFVVAQDRLWQMELARRLANGRLSEIVGAEGLPHDRLYRRFKFRGPWDDTEWTNYHPEGRRIFAAYARGVNAYIAASKSNLPVEFKLTGITPELWKAEDILVRNRVTMALSEARREIRLAQSVAQYGAEEANKRARPEPYGDLVVPDGVDVTLITNDLIRALEGDRYGTFPKPELLAHYRAWPNATPSTDLGMPETSPGSNNFAIRSTMTATGKAFMVDDPHREVTMPALRYIIHLSAPGWNVAGATEPGLPGVIRGHNEYISWGRTASAADEADIYVEQLNPANPNQVKWRDGWENLRVVTETINVRGSSPETLTVKISRHGPVFFEDAAHHVAYALKSSMMSAGTAEYLGALRLDQAKSARECLSGSRYLRAPATNLVCADIEGNVAFRVSAAVPKRVGWNGRLPASGTGKYEWGAFRDDLPEEYNPDRGWIATANNNVQPPGMKEPIFYSSRGPFRRYERIAALLRAGRTFSREDVRRIIQDTHNTEADDLMPRFRDWTGSTPAIERARALVAGWDAEMKRDSAAAALFYTWQAAVRNVELTRPTIEAGLSKAIADLEKAQGADWSRWRWGAINRSTFPHPLIAAYDLPPAQRDGGGGTVHAIGSVYQLITDFSNLDESLVTLAPGQSGQPGSPFYNNLLEAWTRREAFPLAFSQRAVDAHAKYRLTLAPAK